MERTNSFTAIQIEGDCDENSSSDYHYQPLYNIEQQDPWLQLREQFEFHKKNIQNEKKLIFETSCSTKNGIFQISSGMSAARNFTPVIKIDNWLDVAFTFNEEDWYTFMFHLKTMMIHHQNYDTIRFGDDNQYTMERIHSDVCYNGEICCGCDFKIELANEEDGVITHRLCFTKGIVGNIIELEEWIFYRMRLMKQLNFNEFYTKFVHFITSDSSEDISPVWIDLKLFCLRDVVTNENNKFKNDVSVMKQSL